MHKSEQRAMINTAEEFLRLRTSENPDEYHRAAHEEAPIEVWLEVIRRFPDMRFWVAANKTVPVKILDILSNEPDGRVRYMVASKRKLPESLQLKLAVDADPAVRHRIAFNPKATRKVLELLSHDERPEIRELVSKRIAKKEYIVSQQSAEGDKPSPQTG